MREYDKSLAAFSEALAKRPNDVRLYQYITELWRRQGFFEEAIDYMEKGLRLDPFNVNTMTKLTGVPCVLRGFFFTKNSEFQHLYANTRFQNLIEMQDKQKSRFMY